MRMVSAIDGVVSVSVNSAMNRRCILSLLAGFLGPGGVPSPVSAGYVVPGVAVVHQSTLRRMCLWRTARQCAVGSRGLAPGAAGQGPGASTPSSVGRASLHPEAYRA